MSTTQEVRDGDTSLEVEAAADHGHHWLIESPNGPTSVGTCKVCGLIREFKNSIQITSWESDGNHVNRNQAIPTS
tara:strand:+ start:1799 stop:2023 length:225 start_codon:yes stop_codon:yes gene_type:complete